MRGPATALAAVLAAVLVAAPVAQAQQYFTGMRAGDCARMGGRINVYTGPVGSDVGECYVPPQAGGGGGGGYSSGGGYSYGGGNDAAAIGLGVAAGVMLLGMIFDIVDKWGRSGSGSGISGSTGAPSAPVWTPPPAVSYFDSPEFREELRRARERNAALDSATSGVQDFVRGRGQRNALSGTRCNGYPATREGVGQCHLAAATALEQRAGACRDEGCRTASLHGAAAARCTAGFDPAPDNMDIFSGQCARSPGEYARFKQRLREYFPWADDVRHARQVYRTRDELRGSIHVKEKDALRQLAGEGGGDVNATMTWVDRQGNVLHRQELRLDRRCLDDASTATICDLAWKARDAKVRGWKPNTPFNCGRARGTWEGDIVNGYCRYPGVDRPAWTPQPYVAEDLRLLNATVDNALRLNQEGHVQGAYRQALYAEQVLGTIMMLTTTMSPQERGAALDNGLAQIDRLVRALR